MKESRPFIKTIRSGVVETIHRASIVAVQEGKIIYSHGDTDLVFPLRSVAKPFMLFPLMDFVEMGRVHLSDAQICIMASSHNGELVHRDCVSSILELSHSTYHDLACGGHLPFYDFLYRDFFDCLDLDKRQLFHNCSGKHAGMLLLCYLLNIESNKYWLSDHPIQQAIMRAAKDYFEISDRDYFSVVIDGCGVPTYALSLTKLAVAYQNISTSSLLSRVYNAILSEPYMIAGKKRIDTIILEKLGFIAKSGSDGVFCINSSKKKIGIALKIESGNDDAAEAAIVEVLDRLGLLSEAERLMLEKYRRLDIYTSTGLISGNYCTIL